MQQLQDYLTHQTGGPKVLLQDSQGTATRWLLFREPLAILVAERRSDVWPLLAEVEAQTRSGHWAAGFLSYEAGPALDPALAAFEARELPLAWWGIFEEPREVSLKVHSPRHALSIDWRPTLSRQRYRRTVERIRELIARGDTYQVNYTFPLESHFDGDPEELFAAMCAAQQARYCAFLDCGRFALCSASPELFFTIDGERIVSRPMKGTARRGRYPAEDSRHANRLVTSEKERAENVMIVDMMRNDLGRIAIPGSVEVEDLFTVETYPTVHQLTSTVSARTRAPYAEVLRALFPSASITGAPKVSTSRIIRRLETGPRGAYTGSIGYFAPNRRAQLNVAIRTATVDREAKIASYGTGGGIVWDSSSDAEYQECRAKALVLGRPLPEFALLETLLWRPRTHYFLLDRHLDRLLASGRYFDFSLKADKILDALKLRAAGFEPVRHRVRLVVQRDARFEITAEPWHCSGPETWTLALDDRPVDDTDPFLFHKTTSRGLYSQALARHPEADEVVLWNARGELTEATRANLVLKLDGEWLTPPVDCGLLAGTYRAELLERGRIREQRLDVTALQEAEEVALINSLRGWIRTRGSITRQRKNLRARTA